MNKKVDQVFDLLLVLLLCILSIVFVLIEPFNQTPLRIVFALPILLFLPGYTLITTMFPRKTELTGIERFTLSVGLSIAIFVFDGFALSVTPWLFRPMPIVVSLTYITVLFIILTLVRRARLPAEEAYFFGPSTIAEFIDSIRVKEEATDIEKALIVALVGSIIIASGMLIYAKLTFEEEKFSTIYILGEGGKAEDYPSELYILEDNPIIVGVENFEHAPANYTLQVTMGDYLLDERQISLEHQEKWEKELDLTPRHLGKNLRLEFTLYKGESRNPYRSVHLWVDSVVNYDNLDRIREYALSDLPAITNPDMESVSGWELDSNSNYFRGYYTKFHQVVENSTLKGYVVSENTSKPISDARISITNRYETQKTANTDENGTYSFSLAPDHYWITVNAKGYKKNETEIDLEGSKFLNLTTFKLPEKEKEVYKPLNKTKEELSEINESIEEHSPDELPHSISVLKGFAVNPYTGETVSNASIKVKHELGFTRTTTTNDTGYYEVKVISGKHRIEIRAEGYAMNITNYEIGSIHTLDLRLTPISCKVKGYVFDENGKPVLDANLRLSTGKYSTSTKSNFTGYYEMSTIPGEASLSASKRGHFDNSSTFNLTAYSTEMVNMTLMNIPPPSIVEGHVSYDGKGLSGIDVVVRGTDFRGNPIEKSTTTGRNGYFDLEVMPGDVYLDVLQGYMKENISFYAESGKQADFDVELDSNPYSNYKVIYPSQTSLRNGFFGGISQIVNTDEGLATLSFKVKDSGRRSSDVVKQVVLNGTVIWEDSWGGEGWQEVEIPVTFDSGPNELLFRAYAKKDSSGPITVLWDDIEIGSINNILKEQTTKFKVLDSEGGKDYPHRLYLGHPVEFTARVENNEQQEVNYTLQVDLGGVTHEIENIRLKDDEVWEKRIELTPSVMGDFMRLEFLLYKDSELYKQKDLWVSSELKDDEEVLEQFSVPLPELEGWDMESTGWNYVESDANFTGGIVDNTFISPYHSYEIDTRGYSGYAGIQQNFSVDAPANAIISFNVKDSYTQSRGGNYYKQVLLNGEVVWEDDVAGDEGWLHENVPATILSSDSSITLRVQGDGGDPVKVWWDNVEIKPITEFKKGPTRFSVLDGRGGEDHPQTLYLGKATNYTVEVENNERQRMDYRLDVKFDGETINTESFSLEHEEELKRKVEVVPDAIGDRLKLEFILYKGGGDEAYRYFSQHVSARIDYSDLEAIKDYELSIPPPVGNSGMEMGTSKWSFNKDGYISWDTSSEAYKGNSSLRFYQDGKIYSGDYLTAYQDVSSANEGAVFITFSVKDNYHDRNSTGLMKQVLFNDEVLWESDVSDGTGWENVKVPVYFSGQNRVSLKVVAEEDVERSEIEVYWDEVKIKSITGGLS